MFDLIEILIGWAYLEEFESDNQDEDELTED